MIWVTPEHKFYFTDEPLTDSFILTSVSINTEPSDNRSQGIWVYDANTKELISYEKSVKECEMKYNISRTHGYVNIIKLTRVNCLVILNFNRFCVPPAK